MVDIENYYIIIKIHYVINILLVRRVVWMKTGLQFNLKIRLLLFSTYI